MNLSLKDPLLRENSADSGCSPSPSKFQRDFFIKSACCREKKGVSAVIFTAKGAKTANKKGSVPRKPLLHSQKVFAQREPSLPCLKSPATGAFPLSSILPTVVTQNLRKFVWSVSPCSCRSRCSRFRILKRHVRCKLSGMYCLNSISVRLRVDQWLWR